MAKSGTAINSISSSIADGIHFRERSRHLPLPPFIISNSDEINSAQGGPKNIYVDIEHEQKVNFQLPANRRTSICHQNSQPTLRERIKGSPRFPHRIAPTSSLNALEDNRRKSSSSSSSNAGISKKIFTKKKKKYDMFKCIKYCGSSFFFSSMDNFHHFCFVLLKASNPCQDQFRKNVKRK